MEHDVQHGDGYEAGQQQRAEPALAPPRAPELDDVAWTGLPATRRNRCHALIMVAAGRDGYRS
jgi:hypothetical protein